MNDERYEIRPIECRLNDRFIIYDTYNNRTMFGSSTCESTARYSMMLKRCNKLNEDHNSYLKEIIEYCNERCFCNI